MTRRPVEFATPRARARACTATWDTRLAGRTLNTPHQGKENRMKRIAFLIAMTCLLGTALVGCKAEGEIGDAASQVPAAR